MEKSKLWTKDFLSISLASFFIFLIFYMLTVTLPIYVSEQLEGNAQDIGLAVTAFVVAAIILRPFAGRWLSSMGQRKILLIGAAIFLLGSFLYFSADSIVMLLLVRILHGVGFGIATTATGGIVATVIPKERSGEGMGYYATFMNLAMVIGPFLGLSVIHSLGSDTLFILCAVFSVFALGCSLLLKVPEKKMERASANSSKEKMKLSDLFERKTIPIAFVAFALSIAYSGVLSFISVYAVELDLVKTASYFFVVYAVFLLSSRPFTGRWFDRHGANRVIYPCILIFAAGIWVLSQASSGWMLLLSGGLIGLGFGTLLSSLQSVAIQAAPPKRSGTATATFFVLFDAGFALGSFLLGKLATYMSYSAIYLACSVLAFLSIGLYYLLYGRKAGKKNHEALSAKKAV
ncbi:MFS transporter [Bacillus massiliglaciei]|uniref:MFS transporter n=1 Tax=Bacillus massiliglaciei TaxID=1816693 RepID=UPI000AC75DEF|nr:MFS transporter [Bacillus massiliglaciei]